MAVGLLKQVLLQDLSILPSLGHLGNEVVSKLLLGFRSTRVPILGFDPSILPSFLCFCFLFFFSGLLVGGGGGGAGGFNAGLFIQTSYTHSHDFFNSLLKN